MAKDPITMGFGEFLRALREWNGSEPEFSDLMVASVLHYSRQADKSSLPIPFILGLAVSSNFPPDYIKGLISGEFEMNDEVQGQFIAQVYMFFMSVFVLRPPETFIDD